MTSYREASSHHLAGRMSSRRHLLHLIAPCRLEDPVNGSQQYAGYPGLVLFGRNASSGVLEPASTDKPLYTTLLVMAVPRYFHW